MAFVDENLDRLIKQCEKGDESISFLAIFSFLEGWLREKLNLPFSTNNNDKKFHFPELISELKKYERGIGCRELGPYTESEKQLLKELEKYNGDNNWNNLKTKTTANRIRHTFSKINEGSLFVVVDMFTNFATYHGFLDERIKNLKEKENVIKSKNSLPLKPNNDSVLYKNINDLLENYEKLIKNRNEKKIVYNEIEEFEDKLINNFDSDLELPKGFDSYITNKRKLKSLNKISNNLLEYENYINELAISLIEARSKKKYETQIIHLSEIQKKLIKEDIDVLTTKEGHSMYIKGGPGTGKTLILIVILFKFFFKGHKSVLLTYYPTLNKYIAYLFELYNDDKLLNDFGISKMDAESLSLLGNTGILKFDDFLLPKIRTVLNIKKTYSINDNASQILEIVKEMEPNNKKAIKLYEEIIDNILPNMIDETKYCTNERRKERWVKIFNILRRLDNNECMLDLYAYYKFGLKNISKQALTNESFDYILIDEAQDLTNAQIFAVNKFVNTHGGLILAGDPSQEIRNKRITMAQLDVNISGGARYSQELTQNFRSSRLIQDLGNEYKAEHCLHIRKNTKSVEGITAGPPPQIYITNDTPDSNYQDTFKQIINSVKMCIEDLCVVPENICIVAFNETELLSIQQLLKINLNMESVLIYKNFSFKNKDDANGKVRLCTLRDIKGIDCAILLFMITDQSKQINNGGIKSELKANAIYTCITRAMYLLQVFVPKYCRLSDLSVAVLVNKLLPEDTEVAAFVEEQNKKERKGIPLKEDYFDRYHDKTESEIIQIIETEIKKLFEQKFGSDENCDIQYSEDSMMAYVYARKKVVDIVQDNITEISLSDALKIRPECTIDDEIEIYVTPKELDYTRYQKDDSTETSNDFVKLLLEKYNLLADRRTDKYGNSLPNSSLGYLNIAGCDLRKPYNFGYDKWPELIKDNSEYFEWVNYPYPNGNQGSVFAFRPKAKNEEKRKVYKGKVFDKNQDKIKISANEYCDYLKFLPAPLEDNIDFFDNVEIGQIVQYYVSDKYGEKKKIAIIEKVLTTIY